MVTQHATYIIQNEALASTHLRTCFFLTEYKTSLAVSDQILQVSKKGAELNNVVFAYVHAKIS